MQFMSLLPKSNLLSHNGLTMLRFGPLASGAILCIKRFFWFKLLRETAIMRCGGHCACFVALDGIDRVNERQTLRNTREKTHDACNAKEGDNAEMLLHDGTASEWIAGSPGKAVNVERRAGIGEVGRQLSWVL